MTRDAKLRPRGGPVRPTRASRPGRPAPSRELLLSDSAGLRALAAGTRQEIVDVLTSSGPVTVAELGRLLGRRPDALYFHLKVLERARLVQRVNATEGAKPVQRATPTRRARSAQCCASDPGAGRAAAVFTVPATIRLDYRHGSRRELARVVRHAVRLAQREFERECLAQRPIGCRRRRRLWGGRVMGWLTPRELERVNTLMRELHELLRSGRPGPGRQAMALGFLLAPAGVGDRRRSPRKTRKEQRT